ncbi:MAG TPA: aldo/keto reductase [Paludibacter sp.]|nr:aldo/keto reductase [Paludibacter sp.]
MKTLLFHNGDKLPALGLGTWLSKTNEVYDAVLEAIRAGYRHIDCAYIYGNEKEIGLALQEAFKLGLVKREDLFITSKLWNSDHAPERVEVAIRKSLKDLQLDYLDLYLIHWPVAFKTGHEQVKDASDLWSYDEMPISSTWQAMQELKKAGLTKHIGVSNFNIPKLQQLINEAEIKPELNQVELHPYFQQSQLVEFCQANQILVTAYSPLGSRHLVQSEAGLTREKLVLAIAEKHACSPAQVLLAWGMKRGVAVIPKSANATRIRENFGSLAVKLDAEDIDRINSLERNLRVAIGAFCVQPGGSYTLKSIWEE